MVSLRIIYFGTPQFAVPALEALFGSRHEVVAVVSQPDRPRGRGHNLQPTPTKLAAERHAVPVLQPTRLREAAFFSAVAALQPDLGVVAAYGRILPDALLELPRLGMINIHGSLLPKYRGAAPVHRAVIAGERETGISIMRVVSELDAGPVFAYARQPIGPDDRTPEIERALSTLGAALVVTVADSLADGRPPEAPQNQAEATYATKIEKHEGAIDWDQPAIRLHDLIRGLQPWPLVSGRFGPMRCLVHRAMLGAETTSEKGGTILTAGSGALPVAGSDGRVLQILELQPEGKRTMSARDFLAGHPLPRGSRIERA